MKKVHCFFEQSGTFKNEFKKLGYDAVDYDILNDFNETDYIIDLFNEIEKAYKGEKSIFDNIDKDDLIMAFFPCIRFSVQSILNSTCQNKGMKDWNDIDKLEYSMKLQDELNHLYQLISKLMIVCLRGGLKLIVENPYSSQHYLVRYFPIKAKLIDYDRRENGDYYQKPTQYFFINLEPKFNLLFEPIMNTTHKKVSLENKVNRSMISKEYANRFIRTYIIEKE